MMGRAMGSHLRAGAAGLAALMGSRSSTRLETVVSVSLNGASAMAVTNEDYICSTMDYWPPNKCDYGVCAWTEEPYGGSPNIFSQDLTKPLFRAAVKQLAPFYLRLGGSLQDNISYEPKEPCEAMHDDPNNHWGFNGGCLKQERWKKIGGLCSELGCKLIFGLNGLVGRVQVSGTHWTGMWDSTNARQLIQYTKDQGIEVYAWELGNELGGWNGIQAQLSPEEVAQDFIELNRIVKHVYGEGQRPLIMGPDNTMDNDWYSRFLAAVGQNIDVVNIHLYALGPGKDPELRKKIMDPEHTKEAQTAANDLVAAVRSTGKHLPMWMGESGGAYNSGQNGTSNRFIASFWSLSELGIFARAGFASYCRQSFLGGNYALLDKDTLKPYPDFFSFKLFKTVMGSVVLDVTPPENHEVKAFAHCARGVDGGVALLLLNFSPTEAFIVAPRMGDGAALGGERQEYVLTSPDTLQMYGGAVVHLNGQGLHVQDDGTYPDLRPKYVGAGEALNLQPTSIGFYVFPTAAAAACRRI